MDNIKCQQCGRDRREVDAADFDLDDTLCVDCDAANRDLPAQEVRASKAGK